MRRVRPFAALIAGAAALGAATSAAAQPTHPRGADSAQVARVREELRTLISEVNAALRRRDRVALERYFAEEYIWAHAIGYVNDRATHLAEQLGLDSVVGFRPSFDPPGELLVYGDVAVLRTPAPGGLPISGGRAALNSWVFVRQSGRWRIVQTQGTLLQPERTPHSLSTALLDAYAGRYGDGGTVTTVVRREGAGLVATRPNSAIPPRVLMPVSDSVFFDKLGTEYTFRRGADGRVAALISRAAFGREMRRERMP